MSLVNCHIRDNTDPPFLATMSNGFRFAHHIGLIAIIGAGLSRRLLSDRRP